MNVVFAKKGNKLHKYFIISIMKFSKAIKLRFVLQFFFTFLLINLLCRFFRKDHLAEHFTTHTKTLPFHCPICNRGFQRQIAMRAHFQNEHVGQHDLVKTCPLCSYRAGTMKSLRVHFYNR